VAENERLWWLADPLHSRPGNDRRTEHFSRLTLNRLQERASSGYGIGWGVDLAEILVRYGWPSHWTQDWPRLYSDARPPITAHHWMPSYHFLPRAAALDLRTAGEDAWSLRGPQPRERYAPRYGSFAWLEHQLAAFRRGDSLIVVAAYDATADTIMADTLVDAALVLTNGPRPSDSAAVIVPGAPRSGRLVVRVADAPLLASVEVIGERRIHWARSAVATALSRGRRIVLSDLAFFTPGDSLPTTFDEFLIAMRTRTTARSDERLGLYWELSGAIDERTPLSARIDVVREGRSWLRRTGERIGVVEPQRGVRLGWGEVASAREGALPRAVSLDLSTLEPGSYRIEVTIQAEGEQPMVASKKLTIVR
jgi:hypothetical protein